MDRVIQVKVDGAFLTKSSKNAGVQGEANVTGLKISMSKDWRGYSKRILWRDAKGENTVAVMLFSKVDTTSWDPLTYETLIPAEPLAEDGWCEFTIEGFQAGDPSAVALTVTDRLLVEPREAYVQPAEPTPTQAQQLQAGIDSVISQVQEMVKGLSGSSSGAGDGGSGGGGGGGTAAGVGTYYTRFELDAWADGRVIVPVEEHGLSTARCILLHTVHMLVNRSAEDFSEDTLADGKSRFVEALSAAIAANSAAEGTYPVDEEEGYIILTWEQVQYYLLEQTLVAAEEATAQAGELGFDWLETETSGVEVTTTLEELLEAGYAAALGGSTAKLDRLWTVEALRGLKLRWGVEGETGVSKKWDCVGRMTSNAWGVLETEVYLDEDTHDLVVASEEPYAGEVLVLAG